MTLEAVRRSVAIRPVTEVYLIGVTMIVLTVNKVLTLSEGIFIFGMTTVVILLTTMYKELVQVHTLVNSQHDDLLKRIEDLLDALHANDVEVPGGPNSETIDQEAIA